jgi:hypothetical protein
MAEQINNADCLYTDSIIISSAENLFLKTEDKK